jgi:arylsulfatase A-like enzyme
MSISRRDFLKTTAGGAFFASSLVCRSSRSPKKPMNILFIMTDQQPISTLGCYGNPLNPTPNLDRLANTGIRFSHFYISAFPCSPSRASTFTGCFPQRHGVFTNNIPLSDEIPSFGFLTRDSGRETAYFGKSHLKGHMYRDMPLV